MASVASELIEEVTAHAQSDGLEDTREICADCTYFPNNLRIFLSPFYIYLPYYMRLHTQLLKKVKLYLPAPRRLIQGSRFITPLIPNFVTG